MYLQETVDLVERNVNGETKRPRNEIRISALMPFIYVVAELGHIKHVQSAEFHSGITHKSR